MHKKGLSALFAVMLASTMLTAGPVLAASHMKPGGAMDTGKMMTKDMDADKDGMVSKDEFMKKMAAMWDKMDKEKKGKVPMSDVERFFNTMSGS
jgi:hypothetical protein